MLFSALFFSDVLKKEYKHTTANETDAHVISNPPPAIKNDTHSKHGKVTNVKPYFTRRV